VKGKILNSIHESIHGLRQLTEREGVRFIEKAACLVADCFLKGNKLLIAGNGGSLCDSIHFAEELTGQFRKPRAALPAIALADPGLLTCVGNDFGFDKVFSRGIEALGKKGDLFIGLTTSGNSLNMIQAFDEAKQRELKTIAFLGKGGGKLKGVADLELIIHGFSTSDRIQEVHMCAIHILVEIVESILFDGDKKEMLDEILSAPASR
jgi:D-sedoheptulose 7-phosphate isomerase